MSEKGQRAQAGQPGGQQATPVNGGDQGKQDGSPPPPPSAGDITDPGGTQPIGPSGGGGGGGGQPERPQRPMSGEIEYEDGTRLSQDEQGNVRYTDGQGRTGLWQGGSGWVDEASGEPMPADFQPKTPGDQIGPLN